MVVDSNVPWDNKNFLLLLKETRVPVTIPTNHRGLLCGIVIDVCDTYIEIMSIQQQGVEEITRIYFNEIEKHIYVVNKLKWQRHKKAISCNCN